MQGGLWNQYTDPIEGEKCYNLDIKQNKDKIDTDKIPFKKRYKMQ